MRTALFSLGALAVGLATANEYPDCELDNCYRNLVDERFAAEAVAWCPQFLAGTTTAPAAIPTNFGNCDSNVQAVSSACSCITYSNPATTEVPTTTSEPEPEPTDSGSDTEDEECSTEEPETTAPATTTSEPEPEPTDSGSDTEDEDCPTDEPETTAPVTTDEPEYTTSTITTTTTRTITQCPSAVPSCPNGVVTTTVETIVTTTVCPVTTVPGGDDDEEPTGGVPTDDVPSSDLPTGSFTGSFFTPTATPTITRVPITSAPSEPVAEPTTSIPVVTAGAARVTLSFGAVAAVAGLFALF
ncbi:hypothetical protein VTJ83DRAFT_4390 [Remersonia thermophila]|uniref:Uncharacterized protein n=1 Tax=Remersonia thermophila TaxID=72144 RepID=A0ABR4D9R9_9PEZI